jgi:hypothetical protein
MGQAKAYRRCGLRPGRRDRPFAGRTRGGRRRRLFCFGIHGRSVHCCSISPLNMAANCRPANAPGTMTPDNALFANAATNRFLSGEGGRQTDERETGMKVRIVAQPIGPALAEVGALGRVRVETPKSRLAAACRFEMNDTRERRPKGREPEFLQPQAKVYVIELDREVNGVESANRYEFCPLNGKTRSGDRGCFVKDSITAEPARLPIAEPRIEMSRALAKPDDDSGVLNSPVRIKELAADRANLWVDGPFRKLAEPFWLDDFHVVIQENNDGAPPLCGTEIIQGREIERPRCTQQRDALVLGGRLQQAQSPLIDAAIVDDDEIELREPGFLQNAGNRPA